MPTTIGFISDVHGDVHALSDALRLLDGMGVREVVCLGDVVDYGIFPDETISLLAERAIPTLRGNHDQWCLTNRSMGTNATDLTPVSRRFLKETVPSWSATIEGVRVAAHHARPGNNMFGVMPDATAAELVEVLRAAQADVVVVGHTHRAMELRHDGGLVLPQERCSVVRPTAGRASSRRRGHSACSSCRSGAGPCSELGRGVRSRS